MVYGDHGLYCLIRLEGPNVLKLYNWMNDQC